MKIYIVLSAYEEFHKASALFASTDKEKMDDHLMMLRAREAEEELHDLFGVTPEQATEEEISQAYGSVVEDKNHPTLYTLIEVEIKEIEELIEFVRLFKAKLDTEMHKLQYDQEISFETIKSVMAFMSGVSVGKFNRDIFE